MNFFEFGQWFKRVFKQNKKQPKTLKEMFKAGLISEEEFLRFRITQQEVVLVKSKQELLDFLKKRKK